MKDNTAPQNVLHLMKIKNNTIIIFISAYFYRHSGNRYSNNVKWNTE